MTAQGCFLYTLLSDMKFKDISNLDLKDIEKHWACTVHEAGISLRGRFPQAKLMEEAKVNKFILHDLKIYNL